MPTHLTEDDAGTLGAQLLAAEDLATVNPLLNINRGACRPVVIESDFFAPTTGAVPGLYGAAIAGGACQGSGVADAGHPGTIVFVNKASTANTGYAFYSYGSSILLINGGERASLVFRPSSNSATIVVRFGYMDVYTQAAVADGIYLEMTGDGATGLAVVGKAVANSTSSTTATSYTCLTATWYQCSLEVATDKSAVTFTIYSEAGAVLWTDTVSTNLPTASGRYTGLGLVGFDTAATTAANIALFDYVRWEINRELTR